MVLTKAQRKALKAVYDRGADTNPSTYREFRKTVVMGMCGTPMLPWAGMWLGIEPDGYTHS